ncbi:MAG: zf-HC2 domain-containing protein [Planctomycetota bacterium]|nr:MAG: zf-HC2 domain-containing protein [Planctomycetota bacterium]REK24798.1 MAG: zf-HC2 domain-containing protein [Planctomycetota bacterium]REK38827.1 MAG: zf-HC2 domain-containing protein [Planctomycetota bacterium]
MSSGDEYWTRCPAGEVASLTSRLRSQTRMRAVGRCIVGAAAVVACGATLFLTVGDSGEGQRIGGVWCSDVMEMAEDYVAGSLDAAVMKQIRIHIDHCPGCRQQIDAIRGTSARHPPARAHDALTENRLSGEGRLCFDGRGVVAR